MKAWGEGADESSGCALLIGRGIGAAIGIGIMLVGLAVMTGALAAIAADVFVRLTEILR